MSIRRRRGFTLLELLLFILLSSVILFIVVSVLRTVLQYRRYSDFNKEVQNTYFALDYMQREFRQATEVRPLSDFALTGTPDKKYLGFVIIQKILPDKIGSTTSGIQMHYIVYYYKNGGIWRTATTKPSELASEGLRKLGGYNLLTENISSVDGTEFLPDLNLIRLRWVFEYRGMKKPIERDFFIRGDGL